MSVDCPPVSALPESSTMSGPSTSHQPRTPGRAPGNHTPRHVQWASAVDEEEVAGRQRDRELESEVASAHELDEAGLDVRMVCLLIAFFTHSILCSQPTAFQTLTHALERHHSSSVSSYAPSRPSRSYTSSSAESSIPASPRLPTSEINVPGEAFIEPHERAGLPASRPECRGERKFSESELHAAHVVRAHSRNPFSKRFFRRRFRPTATWTKESTDTEEGASQTNPPMTHARGGILAALLALYDRDSDVASISDTQELPPRISPTHSLHDLASVTGKRLATASKALHLPESRPRRERNAAGVWGPLIASTSGTLVAAAAPTHSAIAPDVKRPGYHLSRYVHFRPAVAQP